MKKSLVTFLSFFIISGAHYVHAEEDKYVPLRKECVRGAFTGDMSGCKKIKYACEDGVDMACAHAASLNFEWGNYTEAHTYAKKGCQFQGKMSCDLYNTFKPELKKRCEAGSLSACAELKRITS